MDQHQLFLKHPLHNSPHPVSCAHQNPSHLALTSVRILSSLLCSELLSSFLAAEILVLGLSLPLSHTGLPRELWLLHSLLPTLQSTKQTALFYPEALPYPLLAGWPLGQPYCTPPAASCAASGTLSSLLCLPVLSEKETQHGVHLAGYEDLKITQVKNHAWLVISVSPPPSSSCFR